jgi:sigma-B regulation protein RsbU (phosphoserine phosphatase)
MLFRLVVHDTGDPAAIATRMSKALHEETGGLPYATAIVARFEVNPARMAYVNAGHPPGLVLRDRDPQVLVQGGPPLGLLPEAAYESGTVPLRAGDLGLLVTDGVTEALEGASMSLPDLFVGRAPEAPADACDRLLRAAGEAPGPVGVDGWQDDRTAFVFKVS